MLMVGEQDDMRFYHTTWKRIQFKTYKTISRIFHVLFLEHGWPWVTETVESKIADKVWLSSILLILRS